MGRRREETTWMTETRNHFPFGDTGEIIEHWQCYVRTRAYTKGEKSDEVRPWLLGRGHIHGFCCCYYGIWV